MALISYELAATFGGSGFIAAFAGGLCAGLIFKCSGETLVQFTEQESQLLNLAMFLLLSFGSWPAAIEKASREIPQQPMREEIEELPESASVVIESVQEELEPPQEAFYPEETVDEGPGEEELEIPEARVEEAAPGYNTVLDAENFIKQGRYSEAMHIYKTIISEDPENKQVLQRMAELKTLFKILGKDQETHIMQLERFLEGIQKRRDEYFSST